MDVSMYEAQAHSINVDDIATNRNNRIVMSRIKRNEDDKESLWIQNQHDNYEEEEDCVDYVPEGAYDMGWLGYFVWKNEHLKKLFIRSFTPTSGASVGDIIVSFFRGLTCNKSIQEIDFDGVDLLGGEIFTMLGSFFKNNHNLTTVSVTDCDFGEEGGRLFALAIGSSINKSLRKVELADNNISEEGMVDIITALSVHPNLNYLDLDGNRLHKNGCVALATLLRCSAKEVQHLDLSNTEINDEGIEALVHALATCSCLEELQLVGNPTITSKGWQSLASILEAPNSNLREIFIANNNVDDEAAAAFANALENNHTLYTLNMNSNRSMITAGWLPFSKVLCDTSSVDATFLSNHTLHYLGYEGNMDVIISPLLHLNRRDDKKEVATIKILKNHDDFDMLPFLEWEFKCLPLVVGWLERASAYEMPRGFEPNIERRKLSTIYQFVRGLPLLYVETHLRKELEDIKAAESQMEEEQLLLDQRRRLAQERKKSIMRRLGRQ